MRAELDARLIQARPGVPVAQLLADGIVDIGFQQASELLGVPGVRILGVMPNDCVIVTVFAGAVATASARPEGAKQVLTFLASPQVAAAKEQHGFDAPTIAERRRGGR